MGRRGGGRNLLGRKWSRVHSIYTRTRGGNASNFVAWCSTGRGQGPRQTYPQSTAVGNTTRKEYAQTQPSQTSEETGNRNEIRTELSEAKMKKLLQESLIKYAPVGEQFEGLQANVGKNLNASLKEWIAFRKILIPIP